MLACMQGHGSSSRPVPMDKAAAARIQSTEARRSGGGVAKESFASRAQSAADRNAAAQRGSNDCDDDYDDDYVDDYDDDDDGSD